MNPKTKKPDSPLLDAIRAGALPEAGACVVVGVSGGRDSVVLLDALASLATERSWRLIVAHLDHSLREESAADATWVSALAEHLQLKSILRRVDVAVGTEYSADLDQTRHVLASEFPPGSLGIETAVLSPSRLFNAACRPIAVTLCGMAVVV
jgi:tRNA(Ile)-lysidine synthase TilS/MesJ